MNKKLFLVLISLMLFVTPAYAQYYYWPSVQGILTPVFDALGFPYEWRTVTGFLYYFLLPFIACWAIVLGFMRVLRIFRYQPRLELIISFVMVFMTIYPAGWFVPFVAVLFQFAAVWAVFIFIGLFLFGTFIYGIVTGRGWWGAGWGRGGVLQDIRHVDADITRYEAMAQEHERKAAALARAGKNSEGEWNKGVESRAKANALKNLRDRLAARG